MLAKTICAPKSFRSLGETAFTVACVPTGTKLGVSISPWEWPSVASVIGVLAFTQLGEKLVSLDAQEAFIREGVEDYQEIYSQIPKGAVRFNLAHAAELLNTRYQRSLSNIYTPRFLGPWELLRRLKQIGVYKGEVTLSGFLKLVNPVRHLQQLEATLHPRYVEQEQLIQAQE